LWLAWRWCRGRSGQKDDIVTNSGTSWNIGRIFVELDILAKNMCWCWWILRLVYSLNFSHIFVVANLFLVTLRQPILYLSLQVTTLAIFLSILKISIDMAYMMTESYYDGREIFKV
jgi:hypothetical protein